MSDLDKLSEFQHKIILSSVENLFDEVKSTPLFLEKDGALPLHNISRTIFELIDARSSKSALTPEQAFQKSQDAFSKFRGNREIDRDLYESLYSYADAATTVATCDPSVAQDLKSLKKFVEQAKRDQGLH